MSPLSPLFFYLYTREEYITIVHTRTCVIYLSIYKRLNFTGDTGDTGDSPLFSMVYASPLCTQCPQLKLFFNHFYIKHIYNLFEYFVFFFSLSIFLHRFQAIHYVSPTIESFVCYNHFLSYFFLKLFL